MRFKARRGRICRECAAGITCRWHCKLFYAERFGDADRGRNSARFERAGWIQAFVFDPDIRKFAAREKRGKSFA